ncbi:MAG: DNA polymerase III subunit delta [Bryobacterales bacterium]|nr:DNA polymerase III subunit delta [Bryobacterales bacterium]
MSPKQLSGRLKKGATPAPGYLFLGAEPFYRARCAEFLRSALLGPEPDEGSIVELDLKDERVSDLIDEILTPSLFGGARLVVARNADQVLPRIATSEGKREKAGLEAYFRDPLPDVVVLVEATKHRWDDRDDSAKLERLAKFYSSVPERVDFKPLSESDALYVGQVLAKRLALSLPHAVLSELIEMLGADAFRLESELGKLKLYVGDARSITLEDLALLVPEARQRGTYEFSDAIADRDRARALEVLDTMAKAGMYWGLQVSALATLFRQALAAKEVGADSAGEIRRDLGGLGIRVWPMRARQLKGIVSRYRADELRTALIELFEADRGLRSARPDDRVLMETLVMKLTR